MCLHESKNKLWKLDYYYTLLQNFQIKKKKKQSVVDLDPSVRFDARVNSYLEKEVTTPKIEKI